jgi:hypothetical protein
MIRPRAMIGPVARETSRRMCESGARMENAYSTRSTTKWKSGAKLAECQEETQKASEISMALLYERLDE